MLAGESAGCISLSLPLPELPSLVNSRLPTSTPSGGKQFGLR